MNSNQEQSEDHGTKKNRNLPVVGVKSSRSEMDSGMATQAREHGFKTHWGRLKGKSVRSHATEQVKEKSSYEGSRDKSSYEGSWEKSSYEGSSSKGYDGASRGKVELSEKEVLQSKEVLHPKLPTFFCIKSIQS